MIGIGDNEFSYFCFPKENVSVTKARLATEELYKMKRDGEESRIITNRNKEIPWNIQVLQNT